ncbi:hypothetical protein STBA_01750 [Streptomyces sp. MP131-18]|nr:hypothetical protein STBA_01750 [Streptomyces sp. MP131-18]
MSGGPWTIERICESLGNPVLSKRFLSQINRAPADELLEVFARWRKAAEDMQAGVAKAQALAEAEQHGEPLPGEWTDVTERVRDEAQRIQSRGAA